MVFKPILTKKEVKGVVAEFRRELEKRGISVDRMILFGSYASGKPHPWSDIDVCVLSGQFGKNDFDEMVRISKIAKGVNYLLETFPLNPRDYQEGLHPFSEEIRKKGKEFG
ncbi:MAG: nucleotidyltransferase domain-containing protein [Deltaproteobacteria bacterium]|nr:nucleotidyltransferase domain-containing protein [Deltaproteobacteria bacterium]